MVIASLIYAILAYERFHRNTALSDSGGNLYFKAVYIYFGEDVQGMANFIRDLVFVFLFSKFTYTQKKEWISTRRKCGSYCWVMDLSVV